MLDSPTWIRFVFSIRLKRAAGFLPFLMTSIIALSSPAKASTPSRFVSLGDFPGGEFYSIATDISADGSIVVGGSAIGANYATEAFRWDIENGLASLGDLPGGELFSVALAVSDNGSVIVGESSSEASECCGEAFRWSVETGLIPLGDLPGGVDHLQSSAQGVSADGSVVVGIGSSTLSVNGEPFRWTNESGLSPLLTLPETFFSSTARDVSSDGSVIVGRKPSEGSSEAYRWTIDLGTVGLGNDNDRFHSSVANAVSGDGLVIVGVGASVRLPENTTIPLLGDPSLMTEGFRWTESSGMVGLGLRPGGDFSIANDVSEDGSVIVGFGSGDGANRALIWTEEEGWENIGDLLSQSGVDLDGWSLDEATGISADGSVVVGFGTNPDGNTEAWRADLTGLVGVPEPSTILLIGVATLFFGSRHKRRQYATESRSTGALPCLSEQQ